VWPDFGKLSGTEAQANEEFLWEEEIASTPNPLFRKIVIRVYGGKKNVLRQLTGYLIRPMP
ncbi:MAG TPA: type II secretion system protein GspI, partial [Burkholderiales bacterium]|nr:type II secretion system protein GspI [Burkholderiales bacterium]